MLLFIIPFGFAFTATIFSIVYLQRRLSGNVSDIKITAFSNKIERSAKKYFYKLYLFIAVGGFFIGVLIFLFPGIGWNSVLGFSAGLLGMIVIMHISFLFLIRLSIRFIEISSYGLIRSFNLLFGGGNILGVFVLSASLFLVSTYYLITQPSAVDLIFMGLGVVIASLLFKGIYPAINNIVDITESFFLILIFAIIASGIMLPGFDGGVALPLLIASVGILASALSVRLLRAGATTNIVKNITFSVFGTIVLMIVAIFPLVLWSMNKNVQYSDIILWASSALGVFYIAVIAIIHIVKKISKIRMHEIILSTALFLPAVIFLTFEFAGIYGFTIFVISFMAPASISISLAIFSSIASSVNSSVVDIDVPKEREKIIGKLSSLSQNIREAVQIYWWTSAIFVLLAAYFLYQIELESQLIHASFSLENHKIILGIFAGVGIFFYVSEIFMRILKKALETLKKEESLGDILFEQHMIDIFKIFGPIILFPVILALMFGAEFYSGFLLGLIISATSASLLKKRKQPRFDMDLKNNYSINVTAIEYVSLIKVLMPLSLLLITFLF